MENKEIIIIVLVSALIAVVGLLIAEQVEDWKQEQYDQGYSNASYDSIIQISREQTMTQNILWWNGENATVVPLAALCGG